MSKLPEFLQRWLPTIAVVAAATAAAVALYLRYTSEPWTRFGQVRAYIIEIAPRVSGRVVELAVSDNQKVQAGDLLFRINSKPYELQVQAAEQGLALARQQVAQLEAAVTAARAIVDQKRAAVTSAHSQIAQAQAVVTEAQAAVKQADSGVDSAHAAIDQQQAALELARVELARAERLRDQKAGSVQTAEIKAASVKETAAALVSTQAGLKQSQAALEQAQAGQQQAEAGLQIAQDSLVEAESVLKSAEADLAEAEATLGQPGEANARVRQAQVTLDEAELNLSFTSIYAPSDGIVTNLLVNEGTFTNAGQPQLAFVNSESYWVYGFFRETQLQSIRKDDRATVTLMSHPDRPLQGHVDSINRAIYPPDIATSSDLIPQIQPTFNWVRLAQRVPVRIHFSEIPDDLPLVVGTTVSVSIHPQR